MNILDIIVWLALAVAVFNGWRKGFIGRLFSLAGLVGGRTGVGQRIGFTFARVFLGEFPCLGEVGVLRSVHNLSLIHI